MSTSSLITWHGAGTASLESGILTEESWSSWRCAAARAEVKYGYRLVTEMEGKMVREGGRGRGREGGRMTLTEYDKLKRGDLMEINHMQEITRSLC